MTWDGEERRSNAEVAGIIRAAIKEAFETVPDESAKARKAESDWVRIQMSKEIRRAERWERLMDKAFFPLMVALLLGIGVSAWSAASAYIKGHWK